MTLKEKIRGEIGRFSPITLDEMGAVRLNKRMETKFVFPLSQLPSLLAQVKDLYYMVEICNQREQLYETTYMDTPDYAMYQQHHNGKLNRHKIRIRKYLYSQHQFLEIKKKNNKGETLKQRIDYPISYNAPTECSLEDGLCKHFVASHSPYDSHVIEPTLNNRFVRLTLVCKDFTERVTLDYDLIFKSLQHNLKTRVEGLCIGEIKKEKATLTNSPFMQVLKKKGILPMRYSKYCMGMVMLNPDVKNNLFKKKFRLIEKLT